MVKTCKDCCKEIDNDIYDGYCRSCYNDRITKETGEYYESSLNIYHKITIVISILVFIGGIILGFLTADYYEEFNAIMMLYVWFLDIVFTMFFFGHATIIQELRTIKDNLNLANNKKGNSIKK